MTSNKVINLNKVRAANATERPERAVFVFNYFAPESSIGQVEQRPLVKVVPGSLSRLTDGDWLFKGVNLYRVGTKGGQGGIRSYRLSRINGLLDRP